LVCAPGGSSPAPLAIPFNIFRERPMRRFLKIVLLLPLPFLALIALLLTSWIHTYHRLTDEKLIAELTFDAFGQRVYLASLTTGDLCETEAFILRGDQWRLDAGFVKWKYWATLLGFDAMYRVERLEGRYRNAAEQSTQPLSAYDLAPETSIDLVAIAETLGRFNFLLDATYGSSVYREMDPGLLYKVYRTQTGLIVRTQPRVVSSEQKKNLVVEIDRGCGAPESLWLRLARWIDARI
jgi:hypothetical protein